MDDMIDAKSVCWLARIISIRIKKYLVTKPSILFLSKKYDNIMKVNVFHF